MDGNHVVWDTLEAQTVIPGFHGKFAHSANMTFVLWEIDEGALLPPHSHPHEQVVHVFEGALQVNLAGEEHVLHGGSVGIIPSNVVHSGKALTRCRVMDVFFPRREDYTDKGAPSLLQAAMAPNN